jgi:hypothetical protein
MRMMMIGRKFILIAISMILIMLVAINATAAPILTSHHIVMIQGDDPATEAVEPGDRTIAVERYFFAVPYNETHLEVPVPKNASMDGMQLDHVVYNQQMQSYLPGDFAEFFNQNNPPYKEFLDMTDMDCCYADFYAWEFPIDADRNVTDWDLIGNNVFFNVSLDKGRSDDVWNLSGSDLKLNRSEEYGEYYSLIYPLGLNISMVDMSWAITEHPENVSFFISNDNGTSWMDVTNRSNEDIYFPAEGNEFVWKINMSQDIELNNTPVLDYIWFNFTFLDRYTYVTLQLDYVLERRSGEFKFTWDFFMNRQYGTSPHILIYLDKDHELEAENIDLIFWGDQTEFPEKDTYFFMRGSYSPVASVTISEIEDPPGDFPWLLLLIFLIIAIIIVVLSMSMPKRGKPSEGMVDTAEPEVSSEEIEEMEEMEDELEELRSKKKGLLGAIKKLNSDFEEGIIDEDVYNDLKGSYKGKTIEIMKRMDLLAATISQASMEPQISQEHEALLQEKKKTLLSIKKLDSDFNEGTIDEDTYRELREKYKKRAVEIAKELESFK